MVKQSSEHLLILKRFAPFLLAENRSSKTRLPGGMSNFLLPGGNDKTLGRIGGAWKFIENAFSINLKILPNDAEM